MPQSSFEPELHGKHQESVNPMHFLTTLIDACETFCLFTRDAYTVYTTQIPCCQAYLTWEMWNLLDTTPVTYQVVQFSK